MSPLRGARRRTADYIPHAGKLDLSVGTERCAPRSTPSD